jgi:hypothetical protein
MVSTRPPFRTDLPPKNHLHNLCTITRGEPPVQRCRTVKPGLRHQSGRNRIQTPVQRCRTVTSDVRWACQYCLGRHISGHLKVRNHTAMRALFQGFALQSEIVPVGSLYRRPVTRSWLERMRWVSCRLLHPSAPAITYGVTNPFVQSLTRNFEEALRLMEAALMDCPDNLWDTDLWPEEAPTKPTTYGGLCACARAIDGGTDGTGPSRRPASQRVVINEPDSHQ